MTNDYETLNKQKDHPVWSNAYKRHTRDARQEYRDKLFTFYMRFGEPSHEIQNTIIKKISEKYNMKIDDLVAFSPNSFRSLGLLSRHGMNIIKPERILQWTNQV